MVRVLLLVCVVSLWGVAPALGQQQMACTPAAGAAAAGSTVDAFKAAFDASGGQMQMLPKADGTGIAGFRLTYLVELPVPCQTGTHISADQVDIVFEGSQLIATGNVVFKNPTGQIAAERIEFNMADGTGVFFVAWGILTLPNADRRQFANQEPEVYFYGQKVEKLTAGKYRITRGGFSTCLQPTPRWEVTSQSIVLNVDQYAVARNVVLRVKGVPLLYLPGIYYPIDDDERSTGFLMPSYGTSTLRGASLSNAFFWAISRTQDATVFHDWFTRVGQGAGAEYRYVSHGLSSGNIRFYRFGQQETVFERDGTAQTLPSQISYLINSTINQDLGPLKAQARVEYFTDVQTGQLYYRDPYQQTLSRRIIDGGVTGSFGPATIGGSYSRSEVFTDSVNSTVAGTVPRAVANVTPTRLFGTPVYAGVASEYAFMANRRLTSGVVTSDDSVMRIDVAPSLRAPLSRLTWLSAIATAAYRTTYYSRSLDTSGRLGQEPITRQFLSLQSQVIGPVVTKIWDTPGSTFSARMKHVIEPTFGVEYNTEITNQALVPIVDSTGVAVGGAMRLTYGLTNRLLARKADVGGARGATREFLTIGAQQSYYTDPKQSPYDSAYVTASLYPSPVELSPVAFTVRVSPVDTVSATGRVEYDVMKGHGLQVLTAGTTISTSSITAANISFHRQRPVPGAPVSSYLSASSAMRFVQGRLTTSYSLAWDLDARFIQSQAVAATYMAQCCGLQADFQTVNFPRSGGFPLQADRRFNFAFILSGLGTFSNFFGMVGGQP